MKLTYVSFSRLPSRRANSVQVIRMCEAFAEAGVEVTLYAPKFPNLNQDKGRVFKYYGVDSEFCVKYLRRLRFPGSLYIYALRATMKAVSHNADLLYTRSLASAFFACQCGLDVIFELHNPPPVKRVIPRVMWPVVRTHQSCRRIVCISQALVEVLVARNLASVENPKFMVAHDGAKIYYDRSTALRRTKNGSTSFEIGYVGNLYKGRGVELIVELSRRLEGMKFHIIGGSKEDVARWKARTRGQMIVFHGNVRHSRVHLCLRSFDVVLAPYQDQVWTDEQSKETSEWMSPLKIFEYMESGTPIIVSDHRVLQEVLTDGETAIVCQADKIEDWEEALRRLRRNNELRERLGQQARAELIRNYNWSVRARRILEGAGFDGSGTM